MKEIINGKKYDTDTATEVAVWDNGWAGNFEWYEETLYRKRTGEYFIYAEGGPASAAAEHTSSGWCASCFIRPITEAEARKWGEQKMGVEEYEDEFGEVEE